MINMKELFSKDTWQEIFDPFKKIEQEQLLQHWCFRYFYLYNIIWNQKVLIMDLKRLLLQYHQIACLWGQYTSMPYAGYKFRRGIQLKTTDVPIRLKEFRYRIYCTRNVRGVFGSSKGCRGSNSGTYAVYGEYPEYIKIATTKVFDGGRFSKSN